MTTIPRHVIVDLIPLYLADELSADTRRVVDEYLRTDDALAGQVRAAALPLESGEFARGANPAPDLELQSVRRTRRVLARQRWLFGLALAFTAIGLSVAASIGNGRIANVHLMVQDFPVPFATCLAFAAGCWLAYYRLRRPPGT